MVLFIKTWISKGRFTAKFMCLFRFKMASSSQRVSLEALAENEIQEIAYDGTEKTVM